MQIPGRQQDNIRRKRKKCNNSRFLHKQKRSLIVPKDTKSIELEYNPQEEKLVSENGPNIGLKSCAGGRIEKAVQLEKTKDCYSNRNKPKNLQKTIGSEDDYLRDSSGKFYGDVRVEFENGKMEIGNIRGGEVPKELKNLNYNNNGDYSPFITNGNDTFYLSSKGIMQYEDPARNKMPKEMGFEALRPGSTNSRGENVDFKTKYTLTQR
ncbi:MAG: hypothetical protein ABEI74_01845 [Candidatus Pacearchaeota archaeon]